MTNSNQNDPVGKIVVSSKANWDWLQGRVGTAEMTSLHAWLDEQLQGLEAQYADFVTAESLKLNLRNELRRSRK